MLRCLNTSGNVTDNYSNMTVLERQRMRMKWQHDHQFHQNIQSFYGDSALGEVVAKSIKPESGQAHFPILGFGSNGYEEARNSEKDKDSSACEKQSLKKRKSDKVHCSKVIFF